MSNYIIGSALLKDNLTKTPVTPATARERAVALAKARADVRTQKSATERAARERQAAADFQAELARIEASRLTAEQKAQERARARNEQTAQERAARELAAQEAAAIAAERAAAERAAAERAAAETAAIAAAQAAQAAQEAAAAAQNKERVLPVTDPVQQATVDPAQPGYVVAPGVVLSSNTKYYVAGGTIAALLLFWRLKRSK